MLDIAVIRADPERIRTMLRNRNYPEDTLNEFLGLDAEWRRLMEEGNQLRRKRNEASVQVPKLKGEEKANLLAEMKAVAQRISDIEVRVAELEPIWRAAVPLRDHAAQAGQRRQPTPSGPRGDCRAAAAGDGRGVAVAANLRGA